jgi:hypothetical protein
VSNSPDCAAVPVSVERQRLNLSNVAASLVISALQFTPNGVSPAIIFADGGAPLVVNVDGKRPWSPTGVALHGDDVYVLEYTGANGGRDEGWVPRVRKLARLNAVGTPVDES